MNERLLYAAVAAVAADDVLLLLLLLQIHRCRRRFFARSRPYDTCAVRSSQNY
jgi:hypothetical protein